MIMIMIIIIISMKIEGKQNVGGYNNIIIG